VAPPLARYARPRSSAGLEARATSCWDHAFRERDLSGFYSGLCFESIDSPPTVLPEVAVDGAGFAFVVAAFVSRAGLNANDTQNSEMALE